MTLEELASKPATLEETQILRATWNYQTGSRDRLKKQVEAAAEICSCHHADGRPMPR
jgi:hypothetical protein